MKSAEQKAMEWTNKHMHHGYNRMVRSLAIMFMEQDRDTCHACAEAVLAKKSISGESAADGLIFRNDTHSAVMNTLMLKEQEMGDMPVGQCCVCEDDLDHQDAGFCGECGGAFCWSDCGGWGPNEHRCNNCGGDEDD